MGQTQLFVSKAKGSKELFGIRLKNGSVRNVATYKTLIDVPILGEQALRACAGRRNGGKIFHFTFSRHYWPKEAWIAPVEDAALNV